MGIASLNVGVAGLCKKIVKRIVKRRQSDVKQFNGTSHPQRFCIDHLTLDEKLPYLAKLDTFRMNSCIVFP